MGTVISRVEAEALRKRWGEENRRVVLTNGCYDILHLGHLRTFRQAKALGELLVVGVNSDASVRTLKGDGRPLNPENARGELVAALEPVDFVVIFDELTADKLLEVVRPHVYVKGGDYSPEDLPERETVRRLGAELHFVPLVEGFSTTALLQKLRWERDGGLKAGEDRPERLN